ncbi:hypothetical protein E4U53_006821 [Claviceps sorghi]|nr:hypothetical protein E4U53_006821 [Claviceps sorghi]
MIIARCVSKPNNETQAWDLAFNCSLSSTHTPVTGSKQAAVNSPVHSPRHMSEPSTRGCSKQNANAAQDLTTPMSWFGCHFRSNQGSRNIWRLRVLTLGAPGTQPGRVWDKRRHKGTQGAFSKRGSPAEEQKMEKVKRRFMVDVKGPNTTYGRG